MLVRDASTPNLLRSLALGRTSLLVLPFELFVLDLWPDPLRKRRICSQIHQEGFRWLHADGTTTESYRPPAPLHHGVSQAKFGLVPNFAIGLVC